MPKEQNLQAPDKQTYLPTYLPIYIYMHAYVHTYKVKDARWDVSHEILTLIIRKNQP